MAIAGECGSLRQSTLNDVWVGESIAEISQRDLSTIQALIEEERGEEVIDIVEKKKAWVFKFANSRPYVVPKEMND